MLHCLISFLLTLNFKLVIWVYLLVHVTFARWLHNVDNVQEVGNILSISVKPVNGPTIAYCFYPIFMLSLGSMLWPLTLLICLTLQPHDWMEWPPVVIPLFCRCFSQAINRSWMKNKAKWSYTGGSIWHLCELRSATMQLANSDCRNYVACLHCGTLCVSVPGLLPPIDLFRLSDCLSSWPVAPFMSDVWTNHPLLYSPNIASALGNIRSWIAIDATGDLRKWLDKGEQLWFSSVALRTTARLRLARCMNV